MFWVNKVKKYLQGRLSLDKLNDKQFLEVVQYAVACLETDAVAAERIFSDLARFNAREAFFHTGRGHALLALGRLPEAVRAFEDALTLAPENSGVHVQAVEAFLRVGDNSRALNSAKQAVAFAKSDEERELAQMAFDSVTLGRSPGSDAPELLVILLRPDVPFEDWLTRVAVPAGEALGMTVEEDQTNPDSALLHSADFEMSLTAQHGSFDTMFEDVNWLAWPQGEDEEGVAIAVSCELTDPQSVRKATAFVAKVLESVGAGVVVTMGGRRARTASDWLRAADGLTGEPPLGAFFNVGPLEDHPEVLVAEGLEPWGLASFAVDTGSLPEGERWWRGNLIAAWVQRAMLVDAHTLAPGNRVDVPVGAEVGNLEVSLLNPELSLAPLEPWVVEPFRDGQLLRCAAPWSADRESLTKPGGYLPYRLSLKMKLLGSDGKQHAGWYPVPQNPINHEAPPVEVFAYPTMDGFLTTTVGLGRWAQQHGEDVDSSFAEFAVLTERHDILLAKRIAMVATLYAARGDEAPWGTWHRVLIQGLGIGPSEFPWMVLSPWRMHELCANHRVVHWCPVLVTSEEREQVPMNEIPAWLTEARRASLMGRWLVGIDESATDA